MQGNIYGHAGEKTRKKRKMEGVEREEIGEGTVGRECNYILSFLLFPFFISGKRYNYIGRKGENNT